MELSIAAVWLSDGVALSTMAAPGCPPADADISSGVRGLQVFQLSQADPTEAVDAPEAGGKPSSNRWLAAVAAALLILLAVGLYQWMHGATVGQLSGMGYVGVFLVMVVSGSSTLFPVPGLASVLALGAVWNPLLVGIAAGLGNATGESVAYLAWRAAAAAAALQNVGKQRWLLLFRKWFDRHGFLTVLAIALIPNPVFDVVGLVAAAAAYPLRRFWLACSLGNCVKYVGMAYFGKAAGSLFGSLF